MKQRLGIVWRNIRLFVLITLNFFFFHPPHRRLKGKISEKEMLEKITKSYRQYLRITFPVD